MREKAAQGLMRLSGEREESPSLVCEVCATQHAMWAIGKPQRQSNQKRKAMHATPWIEVRCARTSLLSMNERTGSFQRKFKGPVRHTARRGVSHMPTHTLSIDVIANNAWSEA